MRVGLTGQNAASLCREEEAGVGEDGRPCQQIGRIRAGLEATSASITWCIRLDMLGLSLIVLDRYRSESPPHFIDNNDSGLVGSGEVYASQNTPTLTKVIESKVDMFND